VHKDGRAGDEGRGHDRAGAPRVAPRRATSRSARDRRPIPDAPAIEAPRRLEPKGAGDHPLLGGGTAELRRAIVRSWPWSKKKHRTRATTSCRALMGRKSNIERALWSALHPIGSFKSWSPFSTSGPTILRSSERADPHASRRKETRYCSRTRPPGLVDLSSARSAQDATRTTTTPAGSGEATSPLVRGGHAEIGIPRRATSHG
jgi:hypothetical protein